MEILTFSDIIKDVSNIFVVRNRFGIIYYLEDKVNKYKLLSAAVVIAPIKSCVI